MHALAPWSRVKVPQLGCLVVPLAPVSLQPLEANAGFAMEMRQLLLCLLCSRAQDIAGKTLK